MLKRIIIILLALLTFSSAGLAEVSPGEAFYVSDMADVLSDETESRVVSANDALYAAFGAQVVFVTVDTTGTVDLADFAYTLFNEWGIGSAARNNGILIVMAIDDDDYWFATGTGYERFLTNDVVRQLLYDYLEPRFAVQDYDGGAKALFEALLPRIEAYELLTRLCGAASDVLTNTASR